MNKQDNCTIKNPTSRNQEHKIWQQSLNQEDLFSLTQLNSMIFLDNSSTTCCDPRVLESMLPYFTQSYGNPHSRVHPFAWGAQAAIEQARQQIAHVINAQESEIIFTSGGTESNNLAIKGACGFWRGRKNHIITCVTEHKCVLESCEDMISEGFTVTYLPVDKDGLINLDILNQTITPQTCLVSIMAAHNEIGTLQNLKEIGKICRQKEVWFHTDAAQAFAKIPLDVKDMNIDLMTVSGHKIYGPKGIGALFIGKNPRVTLKPLFSGGGQEKKLRSGTLPTPLCVGLGKAAEILHQEGPQIYTYIKSLYQTFHDLVMQNLTYVILNGHMTQRSFYNINLSFAGVEGESLLMDLMGQERGIVVSSGSACTSENLDGSYTLEALGVDPSMAHTSLRFTFSRWTTEEEIRYTAQILISSVNKLRSISPLWDMIQQGIDLNTINWGSGHH